MKAGFWANQIHPMRYLRRFPEAGKIVQRGVRACPTGLLSWEAYSRLSDDTQQAYNAAIEKLPFDCRPANTDVGVQVLSDLAHIIAFAAAGRNAFLLSAEMLDLFDHTDLGDIRLSDIQFPFRAFYLSFGDALSLALPGVPNLIDGAYVETRPETAAAPGKISFYVTTRRLDGPHRGAAAWISGVEPHFFAPLNQSWDATLETAINDAVGSRDIELEANPGSVTRLRNGVEMAQKEGIPVLAPTTTGFERQANFNREAMPAVRRALGLICNALCYLSAEPKIGETTWPSEAPLSLVTAAMEGSTQKRKQTAKAKLLEQGFMAVRIINLHGSEGGRTNDMPSSRSDNLGVSPHWRRGHWRRQPFGAGRSDVRLKWIKPVLVRKDRGEPIVGHIYKAGTN